MPSAPVRRPAHRCDNCAVKPVLAYDGDCGMCTKSARLVTTWVRRSPADFDVIAYQDADLPTLGLTAAECDEALRWVARDRGLSSAQDAVARTLLAGRLPVRPFGALLLVPGVNTLAGVVYRWVARNRHRLPGGTPACALPAADRPR